MVRLIILGFAFLLLACGDGSGGAEPVPEVCKMAGWECGTAFDLDGPVECGTCPKGEVCGYHEFNKCGRCTPRTCADVGAECGEISDGCGGTLECGACEDDAICGLWQSNQCGTCTPTTCEAEGVECGTVEDGCGETLDCGTCAYGECSWDKTCVCHPDRCESWECGDKPDGCGITLDCGECPTASTIRTISLPAKDLAADPVRGMLYASVPSAAGGQGNSIAVIDTATASIERIFFVGSEPRAVAISSDGRRLWVGLDGSESMVEVDLETDEVVARFPLTGADFGGPNKATTIVASPTDPNTVVVAVGNESSASALAAFKDGRALSTLATKLNASAITFSEDGTTLYAAGGFGDLTIHTLGTSGVSAGELVRDAVGRDIFEMAVAGGKLHCSNGRIIDLATRSTIGTLQVDGRFNHDPAKQQSYFVPWYFNTSERGVIQVFSTERFVPVDRVDLGRVTTYNRPEAIVRYGEDGLALLLDGEIWLIESDGL